MAARMGQAPETLKPVTLFERPRRRSRAGQYKPAAPAKKELVGVDVFLHWQEGSPDDLGAMLAPLAGDGLKLVMISQPRPEGVAEGDVRDFLHGPLAVPVHEQERRASRSPTTRSSSLLGRVAKAGLDFIKTENLCTFDGEAGFSLGQGQ